MIQDIKKLGIMMQDINELIILTAMLLILLLVAMGYAYSLERKAAAFEQFFQEFDTDNDARVSRKEFFGPDDHFLNLDQDADGYIEKSELSETELRRPLRDPIEHFDKDGDGELFQDEFPGPWNHFAQFDTNKDGFINKAEMVNIPPSPSTWHGKDRMDGDNQERKLWL